MGYWQQALADWQAAIAKGTSESMLLSTVENAHGMKSTMHDLHSVQQWTNYLITMASQELAGASNPLEMNVMGSTTFGVTMNGQL